MPVYVMPGQAEGSIALALGYGRTAAGLVGGLEEADVPAGGRQCLSAAVEQGDVHCRRLDRRADRAARIVWR